VKGLVKNITDFGVFLGVEEGIDGLVHISDLSWKKVKHPSEVFRKGQEAEDVVLHIYSVNRRFSLSTKLLEKNPWEGVEQRYKPGTVVEGKITGIADFGAFVLLEEGLEGLIHVSEISRGGSDGPAINVGDTVVVEVLNVDSRDNKIGLSLKEIKSHAAEEAPAADTNSVAEDVSDDVPSEESAKEESVETLNAVEGESESNPEAAEETSEEKVASDTSQQDNGETDTESAEAETNEPEEESGDEGPADTSE